MASIQEFTDAGLYEPDQHGDDRLALLDWLDRRGFSIAEMVEALAEDRLGALAADARLVSGERLSRDQARTTVQLGDEEFDTLAAAFGFSAPGISSEVDSTFTVGEVDTLVFFGHMSKMFSSSEALGFARVISSSIGRLATAAVSLFLADVESRLVDAGAGELEMAKAVDEAIGLLDGFAAHLDPILRRQVFKAIERSRVATISHVERLQFRYAVGFIDLVGFTEISGGMEPRRLAEFIRDFEGRTHEIVTAAGADVVKLIGDEVMFVAAEPGAACRAAHALMDGFGSHHGHVMPRGGVAYGDVLVRGGDYYGSVVNLASRLVDQAVPQELLVTQELVDATPEGRFEPAGRRMVKGFAEPIVVQTYLGEE